MKRSVFIFERPNSVVAFAFAHMQNKNRTSPHGAHSRPKKGTLHLHTIARIATLVFGLSLLAIPSGAAVPTLASYTFIQDGDNQLKVFYYASPEVADWNNDGLKDLLVGRFTGGQVQLFLNQASSASQQPVLNGYSYLESGGLAVQTTWG
jgi:hypothetical protein